MTNRETMELFIEKNGQETVAYPFVEKDHVVFGNGMGIEDVIEQDVTMPTVTHEEVSFKVGVGDQDVSSSIVDSSVGEMVIKGQTYQNILPEPSTHILTNDKEMFKVNEGLDSSVEIVDGVAKSAILKGQTLVNLVTNPRMLMNANDEVTLGDNKISITKSASGISYVLFDFLSKPSAEYTVILNFKKFSQQADYYGVYLDGVYGDIGSIPFNTGSLGVIKRKFTSLDNHEGILSIGIHSDIPIGTEIEFNDIMVLEGDYTNIDIPYFEGMQSVKMPVLTTTGKNLLKPNRNSITSIHLKKGTTLILSTKNSIPSLGGNAKFYDIDGNPIWMGIDAGSSSKKFTLPRDIYRIENALVEGDGLEYQLEVGTVATPYEPYKTNILRTPEEVVLKGINGVKDTLNCNTGEYVQRIKEVVLNGSENWIKQSNGTLWRFVCEDVLNHSDYNEICDKLPTGKSYWTIDETGLYIGGNHKPVIVFNSGDDRYNYSLTQFKEWLSQNPVTVQYKLEVPTIKTVDLSSSGNWEKVVLDGKSSEDWKQNSHSGNFVEFEGYSNFCLYSMNLPVSNRGLLCDKLSYYGYDSKFRHTKVEGISDGGGYRLIFVRIKTEKLPTNDVAGFKQWLSQNPIEVSYMLSSHQDPTQVKQPIFFKDGHIQLSSGADNSLIPTLDYQAKTSNSYVMDLMKANTRYTMKAKSASGTFTIDGTSYGVGTNGTFTTPSSMTNKLLVMSNKTNKEVMILEGDVTDKTVPYFKGIKSAFEGEDKIEVLSTGKNLFDGAFEKGMIDVNGNLGYTPTAIRTVNYISVKPNASYHINLLNLEPFESARVVYVHEYDENFKVLGETQVDNRDIYISKSATKFIKINTHNVHDLPVDSKMIVCENSTLDKQYEPYKSNICKIPLLSPLRSLPNGVCDELIIDRMKKKATLIQRVGHSVINSEFAKNGGNWGYTKDTDPCWGFHCGNYVQGSFNLNEHNSINDKLPIKEMATTGDPLMGYHESNPHIAVRRLEVCNLTMAKEWLDRNPIDFYYQLATPVVTEIDLEGFPYIYKDGHIFLNSKIAPTTQIIYSISQQHQISASTQDLIRHEQELVYLYKLIAQYIQVDYQSTLLSLDLKLK